MSHRQRPRSASSCRWLYPLSLAILVGAVGATAVINNNRSVGTKLRVYRIAIAATGEFTQHHGGSKADALAAIKAIVAELNKVYEPELAIRFQLISDADQNKIIYTDGGTDPFTAGNRSLQIDECQATLDAEIGDANYDIGHVLGQVNSNGGGRAGVGVVGDSGRKAKAISETTNPSAGSPGFMGVLAHEIGHQFGAQHTFNANAVGSCVSGRTATNAYEPASGSTLMSYAGTCDTNNLQAQEDLYFHAASFEQINEYLDVGTNPHAAPFSGTNTGNSPPSVDGGADYIIPAATPFSLEAAATDADGDTLTYTWEQLDLGASMGLPLTDNGSSPLFRSFPPSSNPTRTFPRLSDLLAGTLDRGEKLPTTTRDLNFRVTVRDSNPAGGGVNSDDVYIDVRYTGSPFELMAPNGGQSWTGGSNNDVTWDVAGTTGNGINAANVDIYLSTDNGLTFPFLLATTSNDGSASVTVPNIGTSEARIKVQGEGNIFFDVSDNPFTITPDPAAVGLTVTASGGTTVVTEDGIVDSYQLNLNTAPGGTVTVQASASDPSQLQVSLDAITFSDSVMLNFDSNSAQTIFIQGVDDALLEGPHVRPVLNEVTASTSGDYPTSTLIDPVSVQVVDDESPPVVGVDLDYDLARDSPTNWTTHVQLKDPVTLNDLMLDDGRPTEIDLSLTFDTGTFSCGRATNAADTDTKPLHLPSLADIDGYNRGTIGLTAKWSDLVPGRNYGVYLFGLDPDSGRVHSQDVTITGASPLPTFSQNLVDDQLMVNDTVGSASQNLQSYEKVVEAKANGEISIYISPTGANGFGIAGLAIRELSLTTPGITVDSTAVSEEGSDSSYQFSFNTSPGGVVTIAIEADPDTMVSLDGITFSQCVEVSLGSRVQQSVFVRPVDDSAVEGAHTSLITHTILSSTSGDYPVGMMLDPAEIAVTDDEELGPFVVVDFDNNGGTPANWTALNRATASASNVVREDEATSSIDLSNNGSGGARGTTTPSANTVPTHSTDLTLVDYTVLHTGEITYTWSDLTPGGTHNIFVFACENFDSAELSQMVTIAGGGAPVIFTQATTVGRELWVNGEKGSSARGIDSYAVAVAADGSGEIDITLTPDGVSRVVLSALAIQELPTAPGITVDVGDGITVAEGGAKDTYTVALDTVPAGAVEITVTADAQTEVSLDGSSFANSQSFSRTDTSTQTITVRATDDALVEPLHTGRLTHSVSSTADGANYPMSIPISKVTALITDDDVGGAATVSVEATDPTGAEPSNDAEFTVSLSGGQTAPSGGVNVSYTVSGTATNGSDFNMLSGTATIPQGQNSRTLYVEVIDDNDDELPEQVVITLDSTNVGNITIAAAPDNEASATITSNEQSPYQEFLEASFSLSDLWDSTKEATVWGEDANRDGDVLNTLQEFFHNTSPTSWNEDPVDSSMVEDGGTTYLQIVFRRRKDHEGVTQVIEESSTPASGGWQASGAVTETVMSIDADTEEVTIRYEIGLLVRYFLRLKLED